jgi:serine O-acetyltransferase
MTRAFPNVRADIRHFVAIAKRPEDRDPPTWILHPAEGLERVVRTFRLVLTHHSLQALLAYRMGRWLGVAARSPVRWIPAVLVAPLYLLLVTFVRAAYDIHLDRSADIGPGLYIGHLGGIRISHCRIGAGCSIHQQVRIGPGEGGGATPTVGDRVWIGPHATILGPFHVGERATIGGGAEVTQDIPAGALVLGRPARVMALNYDNGKLL